jgi:hypothetical protein
MEPRGIDSEVSIPPVYEVFADWRASTTNRVVVPAREDMNRFLGSLKGSKIRAQVLNMHTDVRVFKVYTCLEF